MTMMPPPRASRTGHAQLNDAGDVRGNALRDAWQFTLTLLKKPPGAFPGPKPVVPCTGLPAVSAMDTSALTAAVWRELAPRLEALPRSAGGVTQWDLVADGANVLLTQSQPDAASVASAVAGMPPLPPLAKRAAIMGQRDWISIYFAQLLDLQPPQRLVLDLLDIATVLLTLPVFSIKNGANIARPWSVDPNKPAPPFDRPWHPSWPSGHAATAWLHASLLGQLAGADAASKDRLSEMAAHVARNRELAQVHTALDSTAGQEIGLAVGQWLVHVAVNDCDHAPYWASLVKEASALL